MMNDNGDLREDLKVPDGDLGTQIRADFENGREVLVSLLPRVLPMWYIIWMNNHMFHFFSQCTVLKACGEECVIAVKANTAAEK